MLGRDVVRMPHPGSWAGVPGSASLPVWLRQEGVLKREEVDLLTTDCTLLLLEGLSKGHPVPLGWRIIVRLSLTGYFLKNL